ncbi:MAG: PIN domain-containing protein [Bacteroidota bacterium]
MKVVIDTNIVFSAILNTQSRIGHLILNGSKHFDYYTVAQLKQEITEHHKKIMKITGYSEIQFLEIYQLIVNKIKFVDDILISDKDIEKAFKLVSDIDEEDSLFVALSNHLHSNLWTGDKKLLNGLKKKGYIRVLSTDDLYKIYFEKEIKSISKRK